MATEQSTLGRRAFLSGLGAGAGLLAAQGLGVRIPDARTGAPLEGSLRALVASLSPAQRAHVMLPLDHPSRQISNTVSFLDRPHAGMLFDARQLVLVEKLSSAMLSDTGRRDLARTFRFEGRIASSVLAIYGDPHQGAAQAVLSGAHLTLRGGTDRRGGALAYGSQVGNGRWRVRGNAFETHGDAANRLISSLSAEQRRAAILNKAPFELVLQPYAAAAGVAHDFPGLPLRTLGPGGRDAARKLIERVLGLFAPEAVHAVDLETLHFASYADFGIYEDGARYAALGSREREKRGDPYWHVWRIEGPDVVLHFQGTPHVHAYVQVTDPALRNIGESLGHVDRVIEADAMRELVEAALRRSTGEALAYQEPEVPGRFCPGPVTTGLAWTLDPWGNRVVVAEIRGRAMAAPLRERLAAQGHEIRERERYRVAANAYVVTDAERFGEPDDVETGALEVREALVEHLRTGVLERLRS